MTIESGCGLRHYFAMFSRLLDVTRLTYFCKLIKLKYFIFLFTFFFFLFHKLTFIYDYFLASPFLFNHLVIVHIHLSTIYCNDSFPKNCCFIESRDFYGQFVNITTIAQKQYDNFYALALPEENDLPYNPGRIHRSDKVKRAFT